MVHVLRIRDKLYQWHIKRVWPLTGIGLGRCQGNSQGPGYTVGEFPFAVYTTDIASVPEPKPSLYALWLVAMIGISLVRNRLRGNSLFSVVFGKIE